MIILFTEVSGGPGSADLAASANDSRVAALRPEAAALRPDATVYRELMSVFKPAGTAPFNPRSMSDHRILVLSSGLIVGFHFNNMNLAKAKHVNWVVLGVPGVFTKADQQRVEREYGPGLTHFHDLKTDVHGGKPGAKGAWFVHVGVRDFTSPFGKVSAGAIDPFFMPTPPPR